jgi:hypothetical protein
MDQYNLYEVLIYSLKSYSTCLATVSIENDMYTIVGADPLVDPGMAMFTSAEEAALFLFAKYSDGLKPHKHVWDLAVNNVVQPAYTVGCLIPGCLGELIVPGWMEEAEPADDKGN